MTDASSHPENSTGNRSRQRLHATVRVLGWLVGVPAAAVLAFFLLLGIALAMAYPNLPEISGLVDYRPKLPMRVISADGVVLEIGRAHV